MHDVFDYVTAVFFGLAFLAGVFFAVMSVNASGKADFCYVYQQQSYGPQRFVLEAHRPWRPDAVVGVYTTEWQVVEVAKSMNCKLFTETK